MTRFLVVCALVASVLSSTDAWWFFSGSGRQQAQGWISQECMQKAADGDCLFYVCFDQRHPCEHSNYALSYGWRYCDKINLNYDKFTEQGKRWINATRVCAMTKMLNFYRDSHINCRDVESEMKGNHAACEAEHGVCEHDLLMENKEVLMEVYTFDRKMLVRFLGMIHECSASSAGDFLSWMSAQGKTVVSFFKSLPDMFQGLEENIQQLRDSLPEVSLPDIEMPNIQFPKLERLPAVDED